MCVCVSASAVSATRVTYERNSMKQRSRSSGKCVFSDSHNAATPFFRILVLRALKTHFILVRAISRCSGFVS